MRTLLFVCLFAITINVGAQNTTPLPAGNTTIGNFLTVGASNEIWTSSQSLYFNYRGTAEATHFWNTGGTSGKTILTLLKNGNVGVGLAGPTSKLDVLFENSIDQHLFHGLQSSNKYPAALFENNGGTGAGVQIRAGAGGANYSIFNAMTFAGVSQFYVRGDGFIGIGTTSPSYRLEVADGDLYLNKGSMDGGVIRSRGHYLDFKGATDDSWAHRIYRFYPSPGAASETYSVIQLYQGKQDFSFEQKVNITSGGYSYFNGGNVGIGTTAPDSKLTVKGTIHAEEVKVDLNIPAADYVFESDYALMPLSEVKQFVEEKKHLPGIPSGKEMEANGINVSEMNMLLLKKVEELTLHLIELKKEVNQLQQENAAIKKVVKVQ